MEGRWGSATQLILLKLEANKHSQLLTDFLNSKDTLDSQSSHMHMGLFSLNPCHLLPPLSTSQGPPFPHLCLVNTISLHLQVSVLMYFLEVPSLMPAYIKLL